MSVPVTREAERLVVDGWDDQPTPATDPATAEDVEPAESGAR